MPELPRSQTDKGHAQCASARRAEPPLPSNRNDDSHESSLQISPRSEDQFEQPPPPPDDEHQMQLLREYHEQLRRRLCPGCGETDEFF